MHVRRSAAGDPRPGREEPSSKIGSDPHQAIRRGSYCTIIIVTRPSYGCVMLQLPACVSPARSPVFWSTPIPGERLEVDVPAYAKTDRLHDSRYIRVKCGQSIGGSYGGIHIGPCSVAAPSRFSFGLPAPAPAPECRSAAGRPCTQNPSTATMRSIGPGDWWTALQTPTTGSQTIDRGK